MAFGVGLDLSSDTTTSYTNLQSETVIDESELQTEQSSTEQLASELSSTSSLDAETQDLVKDLIDNISTGVLDSEDDLIGDLSQTIFERSSTAQEDVDKQIGDITAANRLSGEQELQALQTQLAQQSGGSLGNTLVASSTAVGRANLEAQLAATEGELTLAGREQVTNELAQSLSGLQTSQSGQVADLTSLLNVLKGADVQESATSEQVSTTESELTRLLDSITNVDSTQQSKDSRSKTDFSISYGASNK